MSLSVDLVISNKKGLHARPAAKLVKLSSQFSDTVIRITKVVRAQGAEEVNVLASSVLGLLMLAADAGSRLTFVAEGNSAAEALASIASLIEAKFEEVE